MARLATLATVPQRMEWAECVRPAVRIMLGLLRRPNLRATHPCSILI